MFKFTIWFDGGARPTNPGNGYGSYEVACVQHPYSRKGSEVEFGWMSNNQAEYCAMIHALKALWHDSKNGSVMNCTRSHAIVPHRITLEIFSDSALVVHQLNGRWKVPVLHIRELVDEARALLKNFGHWKLTWRPRKFNVERFGH